MPRQKIGDGKRTPVRLGLLEPIIDAYNELAFPPTTRPERAGTIRAWLDADAREKIAALPKAKREQLFRRIPGAREWYQATSPAAAASAA